MKPKVLLLISYQVLVSNITNNFCKIMLNVYYVFILALFSYHFKCFNCLIGLNKLFCLFSMMAFGNDSLEMDFSTNLNDISHVDFDII